MRDSNDGKARAKHSCYSGSKGRERRSSHLHVTVEKWASKKKQAAVSGVIEERADVKALISEAHFNLPSLGSQPWILCLQVWCPIVSESSGHNVLLTFGIQDTLSYKVLKKNAQKCG